MFVDTNLLEGIEYYYAELNSKELAAIFFHSLQSVSSHGECDSPYVVFNARAVSNSIKSINNCSSFKLPDVPQSTTSMYCTRYDNEGVGLLYMACQNGRIDKVTDLLLHPEIDVNKTNNSGKTPLEIAYRNGHVDIAKALLQHPKIDVNKVPYWGIAPWEPILANIFLALTGIGLIAITLKSCINMFTTSTQPTLNRCLFFSKMNIQEKIEPVEHPFKLQ